MTGGYLMWSAAPGWLNHFTGKERDAETGLDYFGARYMSAAQGRFTSPDAPFPDQRPTDPQSWNLYSYTRNNPLLGPDWQGRCTDRSEGSGQDSGTEADGCGSCSSSSEGLEAGSCGTRQPVSRCPLPPRDQPRQLAPRKCLPPSYGAARSAIDNCSDDLRAV